MIEEWRIINEYNNYEVSSFGRVRNIKRNFILKPSLQVMPDGYKRLRVNLYFKGGHKQFKVHRLVAKVFIPNPNNKPIINHIDNNSLNNNIENLEWCTNEENLKHSARQGRLNRGENNARSILKEHEVLNIRNNPPRTLEQKIIIAKKYGIKVNSLRAIIRGVNWKHLLK